MNDIFETLGIEEIWAETLGDPRICIAILDGPVDLAHPSLQNANLTEVKHNKSGIVARGKAYQHGTHTTSIIFGQHDGPIKGIAPNCRGFIIPIFQTKDSIPLVSCTQKILALAINSAVDAGANIINISAGELTDINKVDPILKAAIQRCSESDVLVVAAAGNEYGGSSLHIPAALPSVLAVGVALDTDNSLEHLNSSIEINSKYLLTTVGEILGAVPGDAIDYSSGSSCAAAIASGVIALLLSLQLKTTGRINLESVQNALFSSALMTTEKFKNLNGCLNARGAAMQLLHQEGIVSYSLDQKLEVKRISLNESFLNTDWVIDSKVLDDKYSGVSQGNFGTVEIIVPKRESYNIPDLRYSIGGVRTGIHLIPVSDESPIILSSGEIVPGYEIIDGWLRERMSLANNEPIFALLSYIVAYDHLIELPELAGKKLKMGHQHIAAYQGKGKTTHALPPNAPWRGESSQNMKWNVDRYPANVHLLSLKGVPQKTLNKNALIVDTILTAKINVPAKTETLSCRTIDLNTTLQFYRDTIRRADYLEDLSWYTNCATHKSIVINILLNVPHNESAFCEIFGDEGPEIWNAFQALYKEITGKQFSTSDETYFKPLWRLEGLTSDKIKPLKIREYNAYYAAKLEDRLDEYSGIIPLDPGVGMAWPLETVVDVVDSFLNTYLKFDQLEALDIIIVLLSLNGEASEKAKVGIEKYIKLISPIIEDILFEEGSIKGEKASWLNDESLAFYGLRLNNDGKNVASSDQIIIQAIEDVIKKTKLRLDKIQNGDNTQYSPKKTIATAISKLKSIFSECNRTSFFTSPSIIHKLANGLHQKSEFVSIRTVCTAMDFSELNEIGGVNSYFPSNASKERANLLAKLLNRKSDQTMEKKMMENNDAYPQGTDSGDTMMSSIHEIEHSNTNRLNSTPYLVYAFGRIGYRFISTSRRDSIKHQMGEHKDPGKTSDVLEYLRSNPHEAASIQWTLILDGTPIYVIEPRGPFAREAYDLLRQFLFEQTTEGVERVSIPGYVYSTLTLGLGVEIPILTPEIRGMCNWTTEALVNAVCGEPKPEKKGKSEEINLYETKRAGVNNFLERVYFEMRNLGTDPRERALNFAATNAFQVECVYETALKEEMELEVIQVEKSPMARPDADCWDVKLMFFYPKREIRSIRKIFRFTVDVADVVPVIVGPMRVWSAPP